jgi:hypothetical protein
VKLDINVKERHVNRLKEVLQAPLVPHTVTVYESSNLAASQVRVYTVCGPLLEAVDCHQKILQIIANYEPLPRQLMNLTNCNEIEMDISRNGSENVMDLEGAQLEPPLSTRDRPSAQDGVEMDISRDDSESENDIVIEDVPPEPPLSTGDRSLAQDSVEQNAKHSNASRPNDKRRNYCNRRPATSYLSDAIDREARAFGNYESGLEYLDFVDISGQPHLKCSHDDCINMAPFKDNWAAVQHVTFCHTRQFLCHIAFMIIALEKSRVAGGKYKCPFCLITGNHKEMEKHLNNDELKLKKDEPEIANIREMDEDISVEDFDWFEKHYTLLGKRKKTGTAAKSKQLERPRSWEMRNGKKYVK